MPDDAPDVSRALKAGDWYRRNGYNPIASCPEHGHPCYAYTADRDGGQHPKRFAAICRAGLKHKGCPPHTNIQVACGSRWRLAVIDLDGDRAASIWGWWAMLRGGVPETWTVRSPSGGRHLWFRTPEGLDPVPYRILWRDEARKHEMIELLGDGRLAKAPPSEKVLPGGEVVAYRWTIGPRSLPAPAELPAWVVSTAAPARPSGIPDGPHRLPPRPTLGPKVARRHSRAVMAAIPDKLAVARELGLRVVSDRPNAAGWVPCRALWREDRTPSASFNPQSGYYWEPSHGRLSLFDLAVALNAYPTWLDARDCLGERFGVAPVAAPERTIA